MTIRYGFAEDRSFVAVDDDRQIGLFAEPGSIWHTRALHDPATVARAMLAHDDAAQQRLRPLTMQYGYLATKITGTMLFVPGNLYATHYRIMRRTAKTVTYRDREHRKPQRRAVRLVRGVERFYPTSASTVRADQLTSAPFG